ncbi:MULTISPECIES: Asp23/Gls24 family envelope stress response protein [Halanaerobium]|uniref:Isopentenyl transferase n=1 Tax=Halanaerobium kushneri TaxID=56779 RepID=A0A1N6YB44_9FIRM|nr:MULTISPECIES: Asp23/Gls24 family envelope stress response protein [Halanaerobium]RCW49331.1 isopentenyl transferase [Halanaerobium sp. ST460_2HS_T2]SIR11808.1 Isopentenyl transferase [Halanaerobium kushneri]
MKVYALVGPSGTGKSHRAVLLANQYQIPLIVDDGLLIYAGKIMAGSSAKREESKMGAIRRALFFDEKQTKDVKECLKKLNENKILILGTSIGMVERIEERLELGGIDQYIDIKEISSAEEIETALSVRNNEGKHVIPVPTIEVEKDFSGYLLHSLELFFKKDNQTVRHEKSIVRPKFSFYGNLSISNRVLVDLIEYWIKKYQEITDFKKIKVEETNNQLFINLSLEINYGLKIKKFALKFKSALKEHLENNTGINVREINIDIYSLKVRE